MPGYTIFALHYMYITLHQHLPDVVINDGAESNVIVILFEQRLPVSFQMLLLRAIPTGNDSSETPNPAGVTAGHSMTSSYVPNGCLCRIQYKRKSAAFKTRSSFSFFRRRPFCDMYTCKWPTIPRTPTERTDRRTASAAASALRMRVSQPTAAGLMARAGQTVNRTE